MFTRKRALLSSALLVFTLAYAQPTKANDLTGREFSRWSTEGQNSYISTAIIMAGFIAGQLSQEQSRCIGDWYFEDPRGQDTKNGDIRAIIASVPDHHPSATLVALIQRACGAFAR